MRHLTGEYWEPGQQAPAVDFWSGCFERWNTLAASEPWAVAPWYRTVLVRMTGHPKTPGAGRRISIIQRESFTEWERGLEANWRATRR